MKQREKMPLEGFKKKKKKKWGKNAIFGRKMRRYDYTNMDFIAIFQKKCVFKGKKCHLLHGRVIKMGKI